MKHCSNQRGITLIEVIVSVVIIGVLITPIGMYFTNSLQTTMSSKTLLRGNQLAQEFVEKIKTMPINEINNSILNNSNSNTLRTGSAQFPDDFDNYTVDIQRVPMSSFDDYKITPPDYNEYYELKLDNQFDDCDNIRVQYQKNPSDRYELKVIKVDSTGNELGEVATTPISTPTSLNNKLLITCSQDNKPLIKKSHTIEIENNTSEILTVHLQKNIDITDYDAKLVVKKGSVKQEYTTSKTEYNNSYQYNYIYVFKIVVKYNSKEIAKVTATKIEE